MKKRPLCLVCLAVALGIWLMRTAGVPFLCTPALSEMEKSAVLSGNEVQIVGQIKEYEKKGKMAGYLLAPCTVRYGTKEQECSRLYVMAEEQSLPIGGRIEARGTLKEPEAPRNPGQFDSRSYYRRKGVACYLLAKETVLAGTDGVGVKEKLRQLREAAARRMERLLPQREAGILQAMLLGEKSGLSDEVKEEYRQGGILHILSISGLHLMLLGNGLFRLLLLLRCGRVCSAALAAVGMIGYGSFTGNGTATVRAVIMFCVMMGAKGIGRTYDSLSALALAALLMLAEQPEFLFDSAFQMSCAAVLGVVLVYPLLFAPGRGHRAKGSGTKREKALGWMREKLLPSVGIYLAVTAAILPLNAWYFCEIPLLSLIPNLLVGPTVAFVLLPGLAGCLVGAVSVTAGRAVMLPVRGLLFCYDQTVSAIAGIKGGVWICGQPTGWQVLLYYGILLCLLLGAARRREGAKEKGEKDEKKNKKRGRKRYWYLPVLAAACFCLFWRSVPDYAITVLDVGQGDCIVVQSGRFHLMVDGGSSNVKSVGTYRILPWLKQQGIGRLDGIVVTHPDDDHINGILELLEQMAGGWTALRTDTLLLPAWMQGSEKERPLRDAAARAGTAVRYLERGDQIRHGGMEIRVLHPDGDYRSETNAGSVVLQVTYESFTALLTGDLEGRGEEALCREVQHCDFLKVAHHGSKNATGAALLERLQPRVSVISCAWPSRYGHPHKALLERLAASRSKIYGTPLSGAVTLWGRRGRIYLKGYLSSEEFSLAKRKKSADNREK